MHVLAFHLAEQRYALDLEDVQRVFHAVAFCPLPDMPEQIAGVVNLGGKILPVANLRHRLKLPEQRLVPQHRMLRVTVSDCDWLLWVDAVDGVEVYDDSDRLPASSLPCCPSLLKAFVRLPDGLLLIQDLNLLLSLDEKEMLDDAIAHHITSS
ncbi:chemotaxis protein CheW [Nitrincola sp. MINF-07-Sa-05]|uniref:chemotaxis protein CheW n=1 Tax=Nitrincola salilacus TaxID=3400273 RepID=UPI003917BD0F